MNNRKGVAPTKRDARKPLTDEDEPRFVKKKQTKIPTKHFSDEAHFYKKKTESALPLLCRRDFVNIGTSIWESKKQSDIVRQLIADRSECFETEMRPLMVKRVQQPYEEHPRNKNRREETLDDNDFLRDDEKIPDWFEANQGPEITFDFGSTVDRGMAIYKEKPHEEQTVDLLPRREAEEEALDVMLDNYNDRKGADKSESRIADRSAGADPRSRDSEEENDVTTEYFGNLHKNIQKMLGDTFDQREEVDESVSFAQTRKSSASEAVPETQESILEQTYKPIEEDADYLLHAKTLPPNVLRKTLEFATMTREQKQERKRCFIISYACLDIVMNKLVYDFLNSKQREKFNSLSSTGFNQTNAEKYCKNNYKIFSLYMRGNLIQKIWRYKKEDAAVHGPFISYDMDVWSCDAGFFSPATKISFNGGPFLPILMFIERNPAVEWIFHNFISAPPASQRPVYKREAQPIKKVNFYTGSNQASRGQPRGFLKHRPHESSTASAQSEYVEVHSKQTPKKEVPLTETREYIENFPAVSAFSAESSTAFFKSSAWEEDEAPLMSHKIPTQQSAGQQAQNIVHNIKYTTRI